ncbi:annulin-like [Ctenocephalides felis]|uniref:annulin-like n=1 Tax=Ctenocephalides felis TaxID=7515 RepID=UPI000E6E3DA6|nr:annulin-like [Ctenocephalides felis]
MTRSRTNEFDFDLEEHRGKSSKLVVRRGQGFKLILSLSRPYDPQRDAVSFIFTVADAEVPNYGQGTLVAVPLTSRPTIGADGQWSVAARNYEGTTLEVEVTPAHDCIVAQWKLDIDTKLLRGGAVSYSLPQPFYVLYNPWCSRDQVYMADDALREETVMADTGLIWRGSYNRLRPTVWKYAQFEKDILDCALYLITHVSKLKGASRGDPVLVSRALCGAVNSADDNGVVQGNWSDDHGGGTPPTKWIGSMKIMQEYYKKKKPVKYGQCWVFAGVLCSALRTLGIPSRVITNYSSAHDTQASLTVDYFVDEKGEVMEELNSDSIWNYHVWNEAWMDRPDLYPAYAYGGWQAVDATPQELSEDSFRCGPASVIAVKQGEIKRAHDTAFLYAEVNADKVFWRYAGPTQPLKLLRKDMYGIGQLISTKAVGKWEREDVTHTYKYPEKSEEERAIMLRALRSAESIFSRYYLNEDFNDVRFDFELLDDIKIGENFAVVLKIENRSGITAHRVTGFLRVDTVLYTGKVKGEVKLLQFTRDILPSTTDEVRMDVSFDEYFGRLIDQSAFNISCMARIQDTDYEYYAQDDFRVRKPDIKIRLGGLPTTGIPLEVSLRLTNPMPIALKKGVFIVEGTGLEQQLKIKLKQNIEPGQTHIETFNLTPPYSGRSTIVAKFSSKELDDVDGFLAYVVAQNDGGGATGAVASNEVLEESMVNGDTSAVNGSYVNGET